MTSIKIKCPASFDTGPAAGVKITVIKAIRTLTGMGLKDAIAVTMNTSVQELVLQHPFTAESPEVKNELSILSQCGVTVIVNYSHNEDVLIKLRILVAECIRVGNYDIADEMYALVLSQKEKQ